MSRRFRVRLMDEGGKVFEAAASHPFLKELHTGVLPRAKFAFYIRQDYVYLKEFIKVLCVAGAKAGDLSVTKMFAEHVLFGIEVERAHHPPLAQRLGVSVRELEETKPTPLTKAYVNHLKAVAYEGSFAELVAAVLPCYWVYKAIGERYAEPPSPDPVYADWLGTYASEGFRKTVDELLDVVDGAADEASEPERRRMVQNFVTSCRYEYLFWDQAYKLKEWPV